MTVQSNDFVVDRRADAALVADAAGADLVGKRIAYLVNQYPKVSHSFIRREVQALERQGFLVERFALRGWNEVLVDPDDRLELERTRHVLKSGVMPLIGVMLKCALSRPRSFARALSAAFAMSYRSERSLFYHVIYLAHACRVLYWCRDADIHHVHSHFGTNSAEVAMLFSLLGGGSYSFTVHGPDEIDRAQWLGLARKISHAKFVVAISSYTQSQLFRHANAEDWHKIKVVHCGLEADYGCEDVPSAAHARQFLCIGRLHEQKGQLILLAALRRLIDEGLECQVVFAGDGDMRAEIERRIEELELNAFVRISGWLSSDEIRDEIRAARCVVQPSFQEGLPVSIMEAMALQRPVISTYIAGIPELVRQGETGWLVPAADVGRLCAAMRACLESDPDELRAMGTRARRLVVERHSIDHEAKLLSGLILSDQVSVEVESWEDLAAASVRNVHDA